MTVILADFQKVYLTISPYYGCIVVINLVIVYYLVTIYVHRSGTLDVPPRDALPTLGETELKRWILY